MKATKGITFISLLLIATMILTPLIVAMDGGSFGGFDSGAFSDGSFGGFDSGAFSDGSSGGFDSGAFSDGSSGGFDSGAFSGNTDEPTTIDDTATSDPSVSFDDPGNFGSGFTDGLPPITPPGGDTGFPTEADAVWQDLPDVTIFQASPDGTIIQSDVFSKCTDPDDELLFFEITSTSGNYELFFIGNDIRIFDLDQTFIGTETATVTCNGVPESFALSVISRGTTQRSAPATEEEDRLSVFIGAIIIPDQYDAQAGAIVPVTISFKNNGDHELEDVSVAVSIPDMNIRGSGRIEELPIGKRVSKTISLEVPEGVQPGTYYARITIDGSSVHRIKHRDVEVIS